MLRPDPFIFAGGKKPDFVIRIPGKTEQNLVVIEVKTIKAIYKIKELRKDFNKLTMFTSQASYYWAIILIYSGNVLDAKSKLFFLKRMK